jgi:hypothetical protein
MYLLIPMLIALAVLILIFWRYMEHMTDPSVEHKELMKDSDQF